MANYNSVFRSNYFKVKEAAVFIELIGELRHELFEYNDPDNGMLYGFGDSDAAIGSVSVCQNTCQSKVSGLWQDCDCQPEDTELVELIAPHLQDGWVCELQEVGHERLRYVSGQAVAFNNKGERKQLVLRDLRAHVGQALGEHWTEVDG